jgi:hypothetical protein
MKNKWTVVPPKSPHIYWSVNDGVNQICVARTKHQAELIEQAVNSFEPMRNALKDILNAAGNGQSYTASELLDPKNGFTTAFELTAGEGMMYATEARKHL